MNSTAQVPGDPVLSVAPLGFPWQTLDPFLFCVHHDDLYPAGNDALGPAASLEGRDMGQDFAGKDGWRMYHGRTVPGFPGHPHRGFETVTVVRHGLIDHSDSLGATARFGQGDAQWLTAGSGIVHSEMFPLLDKDGPNRLELFQIWLNLAAKDKMVAPYFGMYWNGDIPRRTLRDADGHETRVTVVAGTYADAQPLPPPPNSWASAPGSDVAIWTIAMDAQAQWQMPAAQPGTNRVLYFFSGEKLRVGTRDVAVGHAVQLRAEQAVMLHNTGGQVAEALLLQGRPIGEPVAQYGPFVMNTQAEIQQAFNDYRRTQFGGWPFADEQPVHPRTQARFARHADGKVEEGR